MLRILALCLALGSASASYCSGSPDPDAPANSEPILEADPVLLRTVENGKLYVVNANKTTQFYVTHLYGADSYTNGYIQGQLLKEELENFYSSVWRYLEDEAESALPGKFPQWFQDKLMNSAMDAALDWTAAATAPYTDQDFLDELKGMSASSGVDYDLLVRIHMLPEATKGHCSMFGAWGSALPTGDGLLQLRALDWDTDGPFRDFPAVTVYHAAPQKEGMAYRERKSSGPKNSWANVGFIGFVGSITGMSDKQMAISEIGVSFPDDSFGQESRKGVPFVNLLRDVLSMDSSLEESMDRITNAHRTCDLILGVGDGKEEQFRGVQYSASVANFMDDTNMQPVNDTWHAPIEDMVYWGMDWLCPGFSEVLGTQLAKYHGSLTPDIAISEVVARTQTGNLHIALYDLPQSEMYVSFASPKGQDQDMQYAYQRSYTKLDMTSLFAEAAP